MSKREAIARYSLIIKKLRKKPADFEEISDFLSLESELQEYNFNISKRTFQRDVVDIRSIYNIDIQYSKSSKAYFIDYDEQPDMNERILEAFDTFNALNLSDRLSNHIHFEKRKPQGTENLYGLMHAIKNNLQINFKYQKFWETQKTERTVQPYALKEFKSRWYILAKDNKDSQIKTFALDRLTELEITKKEFEIDDDFDAKNYFKNCFGIITSDNQEPQNVILAFTPVQGKYIKSLPLHSSQEILIDNEKELRVQLKLYTTHDFFMEVLSFGQEVRVIEPKSLIDDIKVSLLNTIKKY